MHEQFNPISYLSGVSSARESAPNDPEIFRRGHALTARSDTARRGRIFVSVQAPTICWLDAGPLSVICKNLTDNGVRTFTNGNRHRSGSIDYVANRLQIVLPHRLYHCTA